MSSPSTAGQTPRSTWRPRAIGNRPHFPLAFHVPVAGGWMDSRIPDIARTLNAMSEGKLELVCRVHRRTHQAECYDLFETDRHGQSHWVMRFGLDEVAEIIPTVLRADRQAPGHDPVTESMRRAHEAKQKEVEAEGIDVMWEFADRVEGVKRDLEGEKVFHGQAGFGPGSGGSEDG